MLSFDKNGFLQPYEITEISIDTFIKQFVTGLEDKNHRMTLFNHYLKVMIDLKQIVNKPFFQWIDGSFTTTKELPNDIDIVSFIDSDILAKKGRFVLDLKRMSKQKYSLDLHFAPTCKWNHRLFEESKKYKDIWEDVCGSSRKDQFGIRHPKGIIQINHR
ncbi:MAG: hypothetical protein AAGJ18_10080, partial [Bacteroidota bacterium]